MTNSSSKMAIYSGLWRYGLPVTNRRNQSLQQFIDSVDDHFHRGREGKLGDYANVIENPSFELIKFKEHSMVLNRLAWTAAEKLGHVSPGDGEFMGDPEALIMEAMLGQSTSSILAGFRKFAADNYDTDEQQPPADDVGTLLWLIAQLPEYQ